MKRIIILYFIALPLLIACSPKNEEVQDEQIEIVPRQAALDTASSTRKDGVRTDENNITPTLPMPQPVMQALQEKYPGWQKPIVVLSPPSPARPEVESPALVRGNFNEDDVLDYALQLQLQKEVIIAAVLSQPNGSWKIYELKRDILFSNKGKLESLYYLSLIPAGDKVYNAATSAYLNAPHDAVAVGTKDNATAYILEKDSFKAYSVSD